MFAKLLKHEWKASAGLLSVLSLAVLGVGILLAVLLRVITVWESKIPSGMWEPIWVLIGGAALAIIAYVIGSQLILLIRFYKNKFTDEGYLTFTLPVTSHQILLSSLLNFLIWTLITTAVAAGTVLMALSVGTAKEGLFNRELWDSGILYLLRQMYTVENGVSYGILSVVSIVISGVSGVMVMVTAITLGAVVAKKHKVLAAFGFYYAIKMGISILSSGISIASLVFMLHNAGFGTDGQILAQMNFITVCEMALNLAIMIAGYFVSNWLIKRKLNLP